jgi:hypothetical protein
MSEVYQRAARQAEIEKGNVEAVSVACCHSSRREMWVTSHVPGPHALRALRASSLVILRE